MQHQGHPKDLSLCRAHLGNAAWEFFLGTGIKDIMSRRLKLVMACLALP